MAIIKHHIRNPLEWGLDQFAIAEHPDQETGTAAAGGARVPAVRRIAVADLREAVAEGLDDFGAKRTDVMALCLIYPVVGLILARTAAADDMLPLLFPLVSGFALLGPVAAIGLYEISRRREAGLEVTWVDAFGVVRTPRFAAIAALGLVLFALFLAWLAAAAAIYLLTLGPEPPASMARFLRDVFTTGAGWIMIVAGIGVGLLFAVLALAIGVVSFPLLLDRDVGVVEAVTTSVRAVLVNPGPMAAWGMTVAAALVLGALPALLGLIVVMPILGHATWHLYRKVVPR